MNIATALNHVTAARRALLQANDGASPLLSHALYALISDASSLMTKLEGLEAITRAEEKPEPGSGARITSTDIGDKGQRIAYVREADQYGAKVMHPACDATRAITGELGNKTVTWTAIRILKGLGFEVRTTGDDGRVL